MKAIHRAWKHFPYKDVLLKLTPEQHEAVLMLLMLTTVVDDRVTRMELDSLVVEMSALPFFSSALVKRILGEESFALRSDMQEKLAHEEEVAALVRRVRDALPERHQKRAALLLVAMLLGIDGVDEPETDFCFRVGELLGLEREDIDQLLVYAWEQVAPAADLKHPGEFVSQ